MTLPVTFSPPGNAYVVSDEDCLRDSVWLMLMADDVLRKDHSLDEAHPERGVTISAGIERTDDHGEVILPQIVVVVGTSSPQLQLEVSRGGRRSVTLLIVIYEKWGTEKLSVDPAVPPITELAKAARVEAILRRGTLYAEGMETNDGKVIDCYHSPLNNDGTYIRSQMRTLNRKLPDITRDPVREIQLRKLSDSELNLPVAPASAFGVLYPVRAKYEIKVRDRESIGEGGFQNDEP